VEVKQIPEERLLARSEYFAGAVGTTTVGTAVRLSGMDASPILGTATLDSVPSWPQFNEVITEMAVDLSIASFGKPCRTLGNFDGLRTAFWNATLVAVKKWDFLWIA
jgi:hypothetical protein